MKHYKNIEEESMEVVPYWERLDELTIQVNEQRDGEPKYKTGLTDLDNLTWGLHKQEVLTVGARTSLGKTAFVTHVMCNLANDNLTVIDFTNEMTELQMVERTVTHLCEINNVDLRQGKAKEEFNNKISIAEHWGEHAKIIITNKYGRRFQDVLKMCHKFKPDFVFIDYIQMISDMTFKDKRAAIEDFLIRLGELSKDLNFGVINVSQINRAGANDSDTARPRMHQLKWAGVLEEFSDTIFLLHWNRKKDSYYIYVDKQRHGEQGTIRVIFQPQFNKFKDFEFELSLPGRG